MKIGILYELQEAELPLRGVVEDDIAEFASLREIEALSRSLNSLGHQTVLIGDLRQFLKVVQQGLTLDLVFNYSAGRYGRAREAHTPAMLDALHIPYTGADTLSLAVCSDKALTKSIWLADGLPTPAYCVISDLADLETITPPDFPVFLKPVGEGSSKGITPDALATTLEEYRARVATLLACYQQPVLAEAYLPGREFTVGILGYGKNANVLGVVEVVHTAQDFVDLKQKKTWSTQTFRAVADCDLESQLASLSIRAYQAVHCDAYARVDIRLDDRGVPYLLEINPNPGLHPERSAMPAIAGEAGLSYTDMIAAFLRLPEQRWRLPLSRPYRPAPPDPSEPFDTLLYDANSADVYISQTSDRGMGVFAARSFRRGDLVLRTRGVPVPAQTEHSIQIDWERHIEPLGAARFLNHGCSPNLGVKTNHLNLPDFFALRDIEKDDELTFDYAMTEFTHYERIDPSLEFDLTCLCNSPNCRGKLGYYSELPEAVKNKYRGFVSSYLLKKNFSKASIAFYQPQVGEQHG